MGLGVETTEVTEWKAFLTIVSLRNQAHGEATRTIDTKAWGRCHLLTSAALTPRSSPVGGRHGSVICADTTQQVGRQLS